MTSQTDDGAAEYYIDQIRAAQRQGVGCDEWLLGIDGSDRFKDELRLVWHIEAERPDMSLEINELREAERALQRATTRIANVMDVFEGDTLAVPHLASTTLENLERLVIRIRRVQG